MDRRALGLLIASATVALLVGAATFALPRTTVVERSTEVAAPQATVYELVSDLRASRRWSPWRDARSRYLFSGPPLGVGARMDWSGPSQGSSVVERADPYGAVVHRIALHGRERRSVFTFKRIAQGVRVTWRMESDAGRDLPARWANLATSARMGGNLERGLARLGDVAEALPDADMARARVSLMQAPRRRFAFVQGEAAPEPGAIAVALAQGAGRVAQALRRAGAAPTSGPVWIALSDGGGEGVRYRAGLVFSGDGKPTGAGVQLSELPAGAVIQAEHVGPAADLPKAEAAARLFAGIHRLPIAGPAVVAFAADFLTPQPAELRAMIQLPVRDER